MSESTPLQPASAVVPPGPACLTEGLLVSQVNASTKPLFRGVAVLGTTLPPLKLYTATLLKHLITLGLCIYMRENVWNMNMKSLSSKQKAQGE